MREPGLYDEKRLLLALRAGSYEAFEQLYDRYNRPLLGNLLKLLKSPDLASETLQELFVRLWHHRASIDPEKPIKGYLFRIAENLVADNFRRAAKDKKMQGYFLAHMQEAYDHIESRLYSKENSLILHQAIDQLPPQRKLVFKLCKLEEKSYREVSELLGISTAAVNDHITKANAFLKEYFTAHPALSVLMAAALISGI
ncbi:MAG: RNA polymerase sigma-70 factor [Sphingobacterium sp.]|jgi:RNA polymerase sigma-70 factor (ECF subfamily)|nr:RNA polymerase sigma-70 factor [Sphingobacterium sp.]